MEAHIHENKGSYLLCRLAEELKRDEPITPQNLIFTADHLEAINQRIDKIYHLVKNNKEDLTNLHSILLKCNERVYLYGENRLLSEKIAKLCVSIIQTFQDIDPPLIPEGLRYFARATIWEHTALIVALDFFANRSELSKLSPDWTLLNQMLSDFSKDLWKYLYVLEAKNRESLEKHFLKIIEHFGRLFQKTESTTIFEPSAAIVETLITHTKIQIPRKLLFDMLDCKCSEILWNSYLSKLPEYEEKDLGGKLKFAIRDWATVRKLLFRSSKASEGLKTYLHRYFSQYEKRKIAIEEKQDILIFFRICKLLKKIKPELLNPKIEMELNEKVMIKFPNHIFKIHMHQLRLLCLESSLFENLIYGNMKEARAFSECKGPIELELIAYEEFKVMLNLYFKENVHKNKAKLGLTTLVHLALLSDYLCNEKMKNDIIAKIDTTLYEMKSPDGFYDDENFVFLSDLVVQLQEVNSLPSLRACMQALYRPLIPHSNLYERIYLDKNDLKLFNCSIREIMLQYEIVLTSFPQEIKIIQQVVIIPLMQRLLSPPVSLQKDHSIKLLKQVAEILAKFSKAPPIDLDFSKSKLDIKHLEILKEVPLNQLTLTQENANEKDLLRLAKSFPNLKIITHSP